jgi:peroxiredoxin
MTIEQDTPSGVMTAPTAALAAGGRLPALRLPRVGSGETVEVRGDRRNPSMILFAHSAECAECRDYVEALIEQPDAFGVWGGRLLVIVPGTAGTQNYPTSATFPVHLLVDEGSEFARRCGMEGGGLLVADAWGEVHYAIYTGESHDLPTPAEVEEWLKFLAIQCPECESPEGAWRTL